MLDLVLVFSTIGLIFWAFPVTAEAIAAKRLSDVTEVDFAVDLTGGTLQSAGPIASAKDGLPGRRVGGGTR